MKTLTDGLAAKLIKSWEDHYNSGAMSFEASMQAEIIELRAALQERDARMPPAVLMNQLINDKLELSIKLAAQRKVLEQVLFTLVDIDQNSDYWYVEKDIAAIKEQLK